MREEVQSHGKKCMAEGTHSHDVREKVQIKAPSEFGHLDVVPRLSSDVLSLSGLKTFYVLKPEICMVQWIP